MGYSTALYGVDLEALRGAIGSNNQDLVEKVRAIANGTAPGERPVDPTRGPRLRIAANSDMYLNGKVVTPDELKNALVDPKWKGTFLYEFREPGERSGLFADPDAWPQLWISIGDLLQQRGLLPNQQFIGRQICTDERQFAETSDPEDDISDDQAVQELIAGAFTRRDCGFQYGYALQYLCQTIGGWLQTIEGDGRLKHLKLDSPLCKTRFPIRLPKYSGFPYVSFLAADEVQSEFDRLQKLDLAYPKSAAIAEDRVAYFESIKSAAGNSLGIVSFYH